MQSSLTAQHGDPTMPRDSYTVKEDYKYNGHEGTGKHASLSPREIAKGLRYKQILVLTYFQHHPLSPASPSMISQWIREKYGYVFTDRREYIQFCKKLYDTLNTLVKRKILYKVKHGLYAPTDLGRQIIPLIAQRLSDQELCSKLYESPWRKPRTRETAVRDTGKANREVDSGSGLRCSVCSLCSVCGGFAGVGVGFAGGVGVLRFHVFAGGGVVGVDRLVVGVELVYRFVVWLRRYLRGVLGVSGYRRLARRVGFRVVGVPIVGVHGFQCGVHRPLAPLGVGAGREVGVDVPVVLEGVDRVHVKFYSAGIGVYLGHLERYGGRAVVSRPLTLFAKGR